MTDPEALGDRERLVWDHLADGEKEAAAWAFDDLDEDEQEELVRKLDGFDRKDLTQGFEQIIERQAEQISQQEERQKQEDQSQSEGKSHGREGPVLGM